MRDSAIFALPPGDTSRSRVTRPRDSTRIRPDTIRRRPDTLGVRPPIPPDTGSTRLRNQH